MVVVRVEEEACSLVAGRTRLTPGHGNLSFSPDSWSLAGSVLVLVLWLGPIITLCTAPTNN